MQGFHPVSPRWNFLENPDAERAAPCSDSRLQRALTAIKIDILATLIPQNGITRQFGDETPDLCARRGNIVRHDFAGMLKPAVSAISPAARLPAGDGQRRP
jgi:hypothetical protein